MVGRVLCPVLADPAGPGQQQQSRAKSAETLLALRSLVYRLRQLVQALRRHAGLNAQLLALFKAGELHRRGQHTWSAEELLPLPLLLRLQQQLRMQQRALSHHRR